MSPIVIAALFVLFEGLGVGAMLPTLSYYGGELGASAFWIGMLFAATPAPKIFTNTLFGTLSDRFGRKPVLLVVIAGSIAASVLWALAPHFTWLLVARLVAGVFGAQATLGQAVAVDSAPPDRRAAAVGMLGAAFGIAFAVGPFLGGLVAHHFGNAAIGWMYAGLQTLSLIVVAVALPETRSEAARDNRSKSYTLVELLRLPNVAVLLSVELFMTVATMSMFSTFGVALERVYEATEKQTGYLFGLFGIVGVFVQGGFVRPVVKRLGERNTALFGAGAMLPGAILFTAAFGAGLPLGWVVAAVVTFAVGVSLLTPTQTALLSHSVDADHQGAVLGTNQGVIAIGRTSGAICGAALLSNVGVAAPFGLVALASIVGIVMVACVRPPERIRGFPVTSGAPGS